MSKVLVSASHLTAIADAIRAKLGGSSTYKPGQMATAIGNIETPSLETLSVSENGTYTPGTGKNGFSSVTVNVSGGGGLSLGIAVVSYSLSDLGLTWSNSAEESVA